MSESNARSWVLPGFAGPVIASRGRAARATDLAADIAAARQLAFEDARRLGFEQGFAEGKAQREQVALAAAHFSAALEQAARPLAVLNQQLIDELTELALGIGKQLARRELQIEPAQVAAIVRETIALLPANSRAVRVFLHPLDAAVLRDKLAPTSAESAWQLFDDPVMTRGGCRIETEHARIDARFESRVAAIAAALLDGGANSDG